MPSLSFIMALALLLGGAAASAQERSDSQEDQARDAVGVQAAPSRSRPFAAPETRAIAPIGEPDAGAQDSTFRTYGGLWLAILGVSFGSAIISLVYLFLSGGGAPSDLK